MKYGTGKGNSYHLMQRKFKNLNFPLPEKKVWNLIPEEITLIDCTDSRMLEQEELSRYSQVIFRLGFWSPGVFLEGLLESHVVVAITRKKEAELTEIMPLLPWFSMISSICVFLHGSRS